ncbi:ABC transporter permease [Nocardioides sp. HDW12B]|uniref:ABC transporter permease n=1 Tax=Nocardioides sp. HDW12B TaxID=2714939 RepID=UPI001408066B|nr:ABC transporter permease [Nocardioides sp. HDW12B]QIK65508.1 ABC transporter permease [Nocardioides sp. HDW12B]
MSTATRTPSGSGPSTRERSGVAGFLSSVPKVWIYLSVLLLALSLVRVITGADQITSVGTLRAALISAMPIALAGLGGLWSERAGVVNIGLEGMMILGTLGAGYYGFNYGVWAGLIGAAVFGAVGGLLHALSTVIFGVDHIVSGVAINIIALGASGFLAEAMFTGLEGGGPTQSPSFDRAPSLTVPGVSDVAGDVAAKGWFLVSDLAGVVGALTTGLSSFTIIAIGLFLLTSWVLWRTSFGLRLRSCGESPQAAETLGVNVYLYKFIAVTMSGALAGAGGAYLATVSSSGYQSGQTLGFGYIGLAAMIFGNWRPSGLFLGALLFGYANAARLRDGGDSVHALVFMVGAALVVLLAYQLWKRRWLAAGLAGFGALLALAVYFGTDRVPSDFTEMTPYIATLLVLALASQSLRMPAADGQTYRRGSAG